MNAANAEEPLVGHWTGQWRSGAWYITSPSTDEEHRHYGALEVLPIEENPGHSQHRTCSFAHRAPQAWRWRVEALRGEDELDLHLTIEILTHVRVRLLRSLSRACAPSGQ